MARTLELNSDIILSRSDRYDLIINGKDNYTLYLPPCDTMVGIEVLMIHNGRVTLDTNSDDILFLTTNSRKLTINSSEDSKGKNLIIESFRGDSWRVTSTTLNDSLLTFEE